MTTAAKFIEIAEAEIGYTEQYDNLTKYGAELKVNGLPWCGTFANWCAKRAKVKIPVIISTMAGAEAFKKKKKWSAAPATPSPGWLAFFDFPNDNVNRISHVGIVVRDLGSGSGLCETIEGNTSGRGSQRNGGMVMRKIRRYAGKDAEIVGFGIVDFQEPVR
jgi:hypothetical protein